MQQLKLIYSIIHLTWLALFLIVLILFLSFWPSTSAETIAEGITIDFPSSSNPFISDSLTLVLSEGKTLFKRNCAQCHNKNMRDDLTGPALHGVADRWSNLPSEDLYDWIRNSQRLIAEEHPKALELWKEWQPTVMSDFKDLNDTEISAILAYIDSKS